MQCPAPKVPLGENLSLPREALSTSTFMSYKIVLVAVCRGRRHSCCPHDRPSRGVCTKDELEALGKAKQQPAIIRVLTRQSPETNKALDVTLSP